MTVVQRRKRLTADEFEKLDLDHRFYELDEGALVETSMPGEIHAEVAAELARLLGNHVKPRGLGKVYVELSCRLTDDTVRTPDVSFVRQERLGPPREGFWRGAPDLAVEVLSEHDFEHPGSVAKKVGQYLEAGVELVWVFDPRKRHALVYHRDNTAELVPPDGLLRGEPVLPGFECALGELFP